MLFMPAEKGAFRQEDCYTDDGNESNRFVAHLRAFGLKRSNSRLSTWALTLDGQARLARSISLPSKSAGLANSLEAIVP